MKRSFAVPIFLMKFLAFSLAVSLTAIYMGGAVTKTVSSFYVERAPIKTVVDAGHGGRDGGAVADDGTLEKDLNLALASSVAEMLKIMGADVVMTRDGDVMYAAENSPHKKLDDLNYRIEKAKSAGDCVFVSIHMNKFPVSKYSGLQVYYSPVNEESKAVAEAVQSAVKAYIQPENDRAVATFPEPRRIAEQPEHQTGENQKNAEKHIAHRSCSFLNYSDIFVISEVLTTSQILYRL